MWFRYWWYGHPFILKGRKIMYCFSCKGWGSDPSGYCCDFCYGAGFISKDEFRYRLLQLVLHW
jgi:hypothetical protein